MIGHGACLGLFGMFEWAHALLALVVQAVGLAMVEASFPQT